MILRLLANVLGLLLLPLRVLRRARVLPRGAFVHVTLDGAVKDVAPEPRFWQRWTPQGISLVELRRRVDEVIADPRARGLVVTLRSLRGGMATATSLRAVLARVPGAGRELVVHLPLGAETREMYVASVATRVFVGPQATVAPVGFASAARYARRALDRAGIEPEIFARGRFKSAGEQLARDSMSEPQREQVGALLDTFHQELIAQLAVGRKVDAARAAELVDGAPYLASDAVSVGLVDGAAYEDELPDRLGIDGARPRLVDSDEYAKAIRAVRWRRLRSAETLGVVLVHGPIGSGAGPLQAPATDERVIAAVRRARADARVAAVVLHVDSPGGGALASDRIHHELERLAAEKPLVAYFGDVAASGGYYVAAPAHAIVAQPTSITGSIGVVAARLVVEPLLAKLGIATEVLKRGAHADTRQSTRRLNEEERASFERELEGMYRAFVAVVARGRKRPVADIERVAEGRVWSGADAFREGLVDQLGGFDLACDRARELAAEKIGRARAGKLQVRVVRGGRRSEPLEAPAKAARALAGVLDRLDLDLPLGLILGSARERVLAWSAVGSWLSR